ncbi:DUF512 domain-containing protein [candidate division KSB1 bacterium]|nr:DUF512 domain-containing protein [candidate division KSB1 bacterium]
MKITAVHPNTPAHRLGLRAGDEIVAINGQKVHDPIDFNFYLADDHPWLSFLRGNQTVEIFLNTSDGEFFGVEFADFPYRCCGNKCVFCFIDQNPDGLRSSLYFKDEDFRLSFLYGNYVTLTNVSQNDLNRIVTQRLSPLYISVHATDPEVRKKMLGLRRDDHLLQKLAYLAKHNIEMHAQIVLCPGWNDGAHLQKTVDDLALFYPQLRTVAIVPVGLTAHRAGLPRIKAVDADMARQIIVWCDEKADAWRKKIGSNFVYLADEFYLTAQMALPAKGRYEDFAQIENGVGMTRHFIDRFRRQKPRLPARLPGKKVTIVTGTLAAPVINHEIMPHLAGIEGLQTDLVAIDNRFYGGHVSVSGLLVGQDICRQLSGRNLGDAVAIPPNCLNTDGLFLDDWTVAKLEKELSVEVIQPQNGVLEIFKLIA